MTTEFDKPCNFYYNAELTTLSRSICQLIDAVNALEKKVEAKPKRKASVNKNTESKK